MLTPVPGNNYINHANYYHGDIMMKNNKMLAILLCSAVAMGSSNVLAGLTQSAEVEENPVMCSPSADHVYTIEDMDKLTAAISRDFTNNEPWHQQQYTDYYAQSKSDLLAVIQRYQDMKLTIEEHSLSVNCETFQNLSREIMFLGEEYYKAFDKLKKLISAQAQSIVDADIPPAPAGGFEAVANGSASQAVPSPWDIDLFAKEDAASGSTSLSASSAVVQPSADVQEPANTGTKKTVIRKVVVVRTVVKKPATASQPAQELAPSAAAAEEKKPEVAPQPAPQPVVKKVVRIVPAAGPAVALHLPKVSGVILRRTQSDPSASASAQSSPTPPKP